MRQTVSDPRFSSQGLTRGWIVEPAAALVRSSISRLLAVRQAAVRLPVPLGDSWELLLVL